MKRIVSHLAKSINTKKNGWEYLKDTRFKTHSHYPEISFQAGEVEIKYTKKEDLIFKQYLHRFIYTEEQIVVSPTSDTDRQAFEHFKSQNPHSFFINLSPLKENDTSIDSSNEPPINGAGHK